MILVVLVVKLPCNSKSEAKATPGQVEILAIKNKADLDENTWNYLDSLDLPYQQDENFEIFTDESCTGFFYYVKDNNGNVMDQGYHGWRGSFGLEFNQGGILMLEYGLGGTPSQWQRRYYDVSNGRVSRFFSKPMQTHDELVAYFTWKEEDGDLVLVIQNMFDPSVYYKEVERDFSLYVYTMPSTAEFLDNGTKLSITYWLKPDDKEVTEIIDLIS
jgi:hypothetical protein